MNRRGLTIAGALAIGLALPFLAAQVGPSGGLPSRPRFVALGLGAAPAQEAGTIRGSDADGVTIEAGDAIVGINQAASGGLDIRLGDDSRMQVCRGLSCAQVAITEIDNSGGYSGAMMLPGDAVVVGKAAGTARTSTTSFVADPDLQVTNLPAGLYALDLFLSATEGGGGFKWRFGAPDDARVQGTRACTSLANIRVTTSDTNTCAAGAAVYFFYGGGGTTDAGSSGTLSIDWGQDSSSASATTLDERSWMRVTRLQ